MCIQFDIRAAGSMSQQRCISNQTKKPSHLHCVSCVLWTGLPCFQTQTDIKELLETLGQNVVTKKRKNVEILWIAGAVSSVLL